MASNMTPKRAAQVLVYDWLTMGTGSPIWMDAEEMTDRLSTHGYKVTAKRREEVVRHVKAIIEPVRERMGVALEKAGFSL